MLEQNRYVNTKKHVDTSVTPNIKRFGMWIPLDIKMDEYDIVYMKESYNKRLDKLAYEIYGNSSYWWVICFVNGIRDPFNIEVGTELKLPKSSAIQEALNPNINPVM